MMPALAPYTIFAGRYVYTFKSGVYFCMHVHVHANMNVCVCAYSAKITWHAESHIDCTNTGAPGVSVELSKRNTGGTYHQLCLQISH